MAVQCIGFLLRTRVAVLCRIACGRQKHVWVLCGCGGKRGAFVGHCFITGMQRAVHANGGATPSFHATCNHHLGLSRGDQTDAHADGIEARAALGINGVGRAGLGQACMQRQHTCGVAPCAQGVAHNDGVNVRGVYARSLKQRLHHRRCHVVCVQRFECAATRHHSTACPSSDQRSGRRHEGAFSSVRCCCSCLAKLGWSVLPLAVMGQSLQTKNRFGTL